MRLVDRDSALDHACCPDLDPDRDFPKTYPHLIIAAIIYQLLAQENVLDRDPDPETDHAVAPDLDPDPDRDRDHSWDPQWDMVLRFTRDPDRDRHFSNSCLLLIIAAVIYSSLTEIWSETETLTQI